MQILKTNNKNNSSWESDAVDIWPVFCYLLYSSSHNLFPTEPSYSRCAFNYITVYFGCIAIICLTQGTLSTCLFLWLKEIRLMSSASIFIITALGECTWSRPDAHNWARARRPLVYIPLQTKVSKLVVSCFGMRYRYLMHGSSVVVVTHSVRLGASYARGH